MNIEIVSMIAFTLTSIAVALSIFALITFQREKKNQQQYSSPEDLELQVRVNEKNIVVRKGKKENQINPGSPGYQDIRRFLKSVQ